MEEEEKPVFTAMDNQQVFLYHGTRMMRSLRRGLSLHLGGASSVAGIRKGGLGWRKR